MEAKKIEVENSSSVLQERPQLKIVEAYEEPEKKDIKLLMLLTFLMPFAGWTYARGVDGLFISLSYIPVAFTLFAPVMGWVLFGGFHLVMTYCAYKSFSKRYSA